MDKIIGQWTKEHDTLLNQCLFELVKQKFETITNIKLDENSKDVLKTFIIRWTNICFKMNQDEYNWYSDWCSQRKKEESING